MSARLASTLGRSTWVPMADRFRGPMIQPPSHFQMRSPIDDELNRHAVERTMRTARDNRQRCLGAKRKAPSSTGRARVRRDINKSRSH
jgi:hypothetical protein